MPNPDTPQLDLAAVPTAWWESPTPHWWAADYLRAADQNDTDALTAHHNAATWLDRANALKRHAAEARQCADAAWTPARETTAHAATSTATHHLTQDHPYRQLAEHITTRHHAIRAWLTATFTTRSEVPTQLLNAFDRIALNQPKYAADRKQLQTERHTQMLHNLNSTHQQHPTGVTP